MSGSSDPDQVREQITLPAKCARFVFRACLRLFADKAAPSCSYNLVEVYAEANAASSALNAALQAMHDDADPSVAYSTPGVRLPTVLPSLALLMIVMDAQVPVLAPPPVVAPTTSEATEDISDPE